MKKRLLALILSALLLINAVACNTVHAPENGEGTEETENGETTEETETMESTSESNGPHSVYQSPIYGDYFGEYPYIARENQLFLKEVDGQRYFCIPSWGSEYATTNAYSMYDVGICGFVGEETALVFTTEQEESDETKHASVVIQMLKIHRDTGAQESFTLPLNLSLQDGVSKIRCSMLDNDTGFLFVYVESGSENYLAALVKTTDGGKTWTALERNESWPVCSWKDMITVSHFFDENKGIIVPRTSAGANVNAIYITLDGGQTWSAANANIPFHDYDPELIGAYYYYLELVNFECVNEKYILTFRLNDGSGGERDGELVLFSSSDLVSWMYVIQNTKESKALKKYKDALYDLINRMVPTETIDWDLGGDQYLEYLSFAIVDMNEDGFSELIVRNIDSLDEEHAVLIYVAGYEHLVSSNFGFRSMYYLKKDGTFSWTSNAGREYGISKLKIDGSLREVIDLYTIKNDGTDDVEFFIYDQKVTKEEFDAFAAQFSNERAEYYDLTEENIEKHITLENLTCN